MKRIFTNSGRPNLSLPREVALVALVSLAQLLTQAGLGQVLAPLHVIGTDLHTSNPGVLSWFAAGYSLTVGTFILVSGRAGDLFGHKRVFILGFIWFGVWSTIAGLTHLTHSNIFFILCRTFQGIGPAVVLPNGLAILGRTYPASSRKNLVFSIFGSTAPLGASFGAIFSALFAEKVNWSWAYYLMGIVCVLIATAAVFVIPKDDIRREDWATSSGCAYLLQVISHLDLGAGTIGITGLVLFNIAWNQAPVVGWDQAYIIVLLIIGLALTAGFIYLEFNYSQHPLVPREIFNRETSLILGCISAGWASFGIFIYYFFQFVELQRGHSPLSAAVQNFPTTFSGAVAAGLVALTLTKVGPGVIMIGAMMGFMLGNLLLSICPVDQTYWALTFISTLITPFGMDMSFPAANVVISDFVPIDKQGNAASLVNTILNYSISIGLGLAGTVEVQLNNGGLNQADLLKGYRAAWRVGIGLASLGIVMSIFLTVFVSQGKARTAKEKQTIDIPDDSISSHDEST